MPQAIPVVVATPSLAAILDEGGARAGKDGLAIFRQVVDQVRALHAAGQLHRDIRPETIQMDADGIAVLSEPPAAREFGGEIDLEGCPLELDAGSPVLVPIDLLTAQQALGGFDPRRIDVYQLGALLCRLLTNRPVTDYLSSPKVKMLVPSAFEPLVVCCLGFVATERFTDADQVASALAAIAAPTNPETPPHGSVIGMSPHREVISGATPLPVEPVAVFHHAAEAPIASLGHYRIIRRIGQGGMGDVYLGFEDALQRHVALKVLPATLARNDDFVRRFRAEATAVARLAHPHIVPIYFIGQDAEHHFYAMQYVEGESLDRLLVRRGQLPVEETLTILEHCLAGLSAAHRAGLVHRDIKPGNILIESQTRRALVADFGLVKSSGGGATATGVVLGTVDYMAPEMARGQKADARSDLYALGVMAYQMLSSQLPFSAETPSVVLFQHAYEAPRPLREAAPDTPVPVLALVEKLMAKELGDRFQSCDEVLVAIRRCRAGELPVLDSPVERPSRIIALPDLGRPPDFPVEPGRLPAGKWQGLRGRAAAWFRRNSPQIVKNLQGTVTQVDGALEEYDRRRDRLTGLVEEARAAAAELATQAENNRAAALDIARKAAATSDEETRQRLSREQKNCEREAADLTALAGEQREQLANMELQLAQVNATLGGLRSQRDILNARLRAAEAQQGLGGGSARPRRRHLRYVGAALLVGVGLMSVYGARLFLGASSFPNLKSGGPAPLFRPVNVASEPLPPFPAGTPLSPITLVGRPAPIQGLLSWTTETHAHRDMVTAVAFSPDGSFLASTGNDGTVRLWDSSTRKLVRMFVGHKGYTRCLAWSPDGEVLATGSIDQTVRLWRAKTGLLLKTFRGHTNEVGGLAWSPDGEVLASVGYDKAVRLWDVVNGTTLAVFVQHADAVTAVAWSPDSKILATGSNDMTMRLWDRESRALLREWTTPAMVFAAAWSPDGSTLVTGHRDKTVRLWDASTGSHQRDLHGDPGEIRAVAWSPDGKEVAAAGEYHDIRVWDPTTGAPLRTFPRHHSDQIGGLSWSPDARTIATGSWDSSVRFWDAASGKHLHAIAGHMQEVRGLGWSPDARTIAAGCWDTTVRLWDAGTGRVVQSLAGHKTVAVKLLWSPDGSLLATGDWQGVVRLWDGRSGQFLHVLEGLTGKIDAFAWSPDSKLLAAGARGENIVRVFNALTGQVDRLYSGHKGSITALAWSPDGTQLAASAYDHNVLVWDVADKGNAPKFTFGGAGGSSLAWSSDHKTLALGDWYGNVLLWDTSTGKQLGSVAGGKGELYIAWLDGGNALASVGMDRHLCVREAPTWKVSRDLEGAAGSTFGSGGAGAFSPDGRYLASANGGSIRLWDTGTGRVYGTFLSLAANQTLVVTAEGHYMGSLGVEKMLVAVAQTDAGQEVLEPAQFAARFGWVNDPGRVKRFGFVPDRSIAQRLIGHTGPVRGVVVLPGGKQVLSASGWPQGDHTLRLWDLANGRELRRLEGHKADIADLAVSPDGAKAYSCDKFGVIRWWNLSTAREEMNRETAANEADCLALTADGKQFVTVGQSGRARLWDAATGQEINAWDVNKEGIVCAAFDSTGKRILLGGRDGIGYLHDSDTGKERGRVQVNPGKGWVHTVAFAPDGAVAALAGLDTVLFDPATNATTKWPPTHAFGTTRVIFSTDGKRLLTCGYDGHVRLWDTATRKLIDRFSDYQGFVWALAFLPGDRQIVTAGGGGKEGDRFVAGEDFMIRVRNITAR